MSEESGSKTEPKARSETCNTLIIGALGLVAIVAIVAISFNQKNALCNHVSQKTELDPSQLEALRKEIMKEVIAKIDKATDPKNLEDSFTKVLHDYFKAKESSKRNLGKSISDDYKENSIIPDITTEPIVVISATAPIDTLSNECYDLGLWQGQACESLVISNGCEKYSVELSTGYYVGSGDCSSITYNNDLSEVNNTKIIEVNTTISTETNATKIPEPTCDQIACDLGKKDIDYGTDIYSAIPEKCKENENLFLLKVDECRQLEEENKFINDGLIPGDDIPGLIIPPDLNLTQEQIEEEINGNNPTLSRITIVKKFAFILEIR